MNHQLIIADLREAAVFFALCHYETILFYPIDYVTGEKWAVHSIGNYTCVCTSLALMSSCAMIGMSF